MLDRIAGGGALAVGWLINAAAGLGMTACWLYQGAKWLKDGVWIPVTVSDYFRPDSTGWVGIDRIIVWVLDTNVGIALLPVLVVTSLFIAARNADVAVSRQIAATRNRPPP